MSMCDNLTETLENLPCDENCIPYEQSFASSPLAIYWSVENGLKEIETINNDNTGQIKKEVQ